MNASLALVNDFYGPGNDIGFLKDAVKENDLYAAYGIKESDF